MQCSWFLALHILAYFPISGFSLSVDLAPRLSRQLCPWLSLSLSITEWMNGFYFLFFLSLSFHPIVFLKQSNRLYMSAMWKHIWFSLLGTENTCHFRNLYVFNGLFNNILCNPKLVLENHWYSPFVGHGQANEMLPIFLWSLHWYYVWRELAILRKLF